MQYYKKLVCYVAVIFSIASLEAQRIILFNRTDYPLKVFYTTTHEHQGKTHSKKLKRTLLSEQYIDIGNAQQTAIMQIVPVGIVRRIFKHKPMFDQDSLDQALHEARGREGQVVIVCVPSHDYTKIYASVQQAPFADVVDSKFETTQPAISQLKSVPANR